MIWSACYLLWMYQRVFFGKMTHPVNNSLPDLLAREQLRAVAPAVAALVMGVAPMLWLRVIDPAVQTALTPFARWSARWSDNEPCRTALTQVIPQPSTTSAFCPSWCYLSSASSSWLLDPLLHEARAQKLLGSIALGGTLAALLATLYMAQSPGLAFLNMVRVDSVQRLLSRSRDRDRCSRRFSVRSNTWKCSGFAPANITP